MIKYIQTSNQSVASNLTSALWSLTRPINIRESNDTSNMFATKVMTDGSVWLQVDTNFTIPVHLDADIEPIIDILEPFVALNYIDNIDLQNLIDLIEVSKGNELNVFESFPQFWINSAKTENEIKTMGIWPASL